jgi:hypothetical protein
MFYIDTQ